MGDRTDLVGLDRGDAILFVDGIALEIARIDMGHTGNAGAAGAGIQICVEHAAWTRELHFGAVALANLELRLAKMLAKLIGRHSIER